MDLKLNGKNALITGGSRGLGRQCALSLANEGVNVAICGRTSETLEKTKADLKTAGAKVVTIIGDISVNGDAEQIYATATSELGPIDILVNNVGGTRSREDISGTNLDDFRGTFDINLFGGYELMTLVIPHMQKQSWGRIVNIGSSSSYEGFEETSIYSASKHAILGFSRSIQKELKSYGIRTCCISPGSIKTKMGKQIKGQNYSTFINPKEIAEAILNLIQFDKEMMIPEIRLDRIEQK